MFQRIQELIADSEALVCVLIDEVIFLCFSGCWHLSIRVNSNITFEFYSFFSMNRVNSTVLN